MYTREEYTNPDYHTTTNNEYPEKEWEI